MMLLQHKDVVAGKKTEQECLREFLDTFDVGGVVDGKVTRQEFRNYYHSVSSGIELMTNLSCASGTPGI